MRPLFSCRVCTFTRGRVYRNGDAKNAAECLRPPARFFGPATNSGEIPAAVDGLSMKLMTDSRGRPLAITIGQDWQLVATTVAQPGLS